MWKRSVGLTLACLICMLSLHLQAEPVRVRFTEGLVHGFLTLRTLTGMLIADGDLVQVASGPRVTARLTFRFRDGSLHDETAVFTQRGEFRLVNYRLQRGPSFPRPLEMTIDTATGRVTVRHRDEDGEEEEVDTEKMELPPDLANGLVSTLLKNVRPAGPVTLSYVAATPKPRLVKLKIAPAAAADRFATGGRGRTATHYVIEVDIGGLSGLVAPLVGKQPPDAHVWVMGGAAPAFVKAEQSLYNGGPTWRIELVSPAWPKPQAPAKK